MDKHVVVYSYSGMLSSNENEQTTHKNVDVLDKRGQAQNIPYCMIPSV